MTIDTLILFAGTFVAVLPFLGFPGEWDRVLLVAVGVLIIGLGIAVRRRGLRPPRSNPSTRHGVHEAPHNE